MISQIVVSAASPGIDWQVILLAVIAATPGLFAAYFANQARGTAHEAKVESLNNGLVIADVAKKTDGMTTALAEATRKEGFGAGVKQEQDATALAASVKSEQEAMIERIVNAVVSAQAAAHPSGLVKANGDVLQGPPVPTDPGPATQTKLTEIKNVVDDVQPRVVAIEEATVARDAAVEQVALSADERLTKLEEKKE